MDENSLQDDLDRARDWQKAGEVDRAAAVYQQILSDQPDHQEARHLLAIADLQRGDVAAAIERLEPLAAEAADNAQYQNNLGNAYMMTGRHDEAAACFRQTVALDPGMADGWHNLGNAEGARKDLKAAETAYREAIAVQPGHLGATANLGTVLRLTDRLDEAIALLRTAVATTPLDVRLRHNLADTLAANGETEEALALAEDLVTSAPDFTPAQTLRDRLRKGSAA